jgi:site-specific DNA-methyltransferase (adenine-specific)
MTNALYYGDNLAVLRESIAGESVDLVYLDPPFNSNANYNVLFKSPTGAGSQAQIEAFEDTWHWGQEAEDAFDQVMRSGNTDAADLLRAMRSFLGENDMMAYLAMMAIRLLELHRVLKSTGSLYLHCDPTASHYLKLLLDAVFGAENYRNEIVWRRYHRPKGSQFEARKFGKSTDSIFFYSKSDQYNFYIDRVKTALDDDAIARRYPNKDEKGRWCSGPLLRSSGMGARPNLVYEYKGYIPGPAGWRMTKDKLQALDHVGDFYWTSAGTPRRRVRPGDEPGAVIDNLWIDIEAIGSQAEQRLGYPTQKPLSLLERIVKVSSDEGGLVLDPFCGCGTATHAAQKLGRSWIGIDITHLAVSLIERRLKDAFPGIAFEVHGTPKDIDGARDLAIRDKYQFQWWATSLIDAQPYGGKKKGADSGIDGLIYFRSDAKTTERAIVSVKGGEHVGVPMIRDLKGVLDREKAPIGVFLTLAAPTQPMIAEAVSTGFYDLGGRKYPRLQIITIEDALHGAKPAIPLVDTGAAFKKATKEAPPQGKLDL